MIQALSAYYYFKYENNNQNNNDNINDYNSNYNSNNRNNDNNYGINNYDNSNILKNNFNNNDTDGVTKYFILQFLYRAYTFVTYSIFPVLSTYSPWKVVLTCPLWFVLAHIHHCIEKIKNGFTVKEAVAGKILFNFICNIAVLLVFFILLIFQFLFSCFLLYSK